MERELAQNAADSSFGLDPSLISTIDWELALSRVCHDLRTDFIWAPHMAFIYLHCGQQVIEHLKSELKAGVFSPGLPITIEVPKAFRIKFGGTFKRLGPNFSRPGSVLPPLDRLLYQAIADNAAVLIDKKTNKARSFSHRLTSDSPDTMFMSTRECWKQLQDALKLNSTSIKCKYVMKVDVADYFGSINQHTLINTLKDIGLAPNLANILEKMLISYTGKKSSRGIIQGVYPSDLFGAFYMTPIDRFFDDKSIPSARYVDDIFLFIENVEEASAIIRALIPELRNYDLVLNEVKSYITPKSNLFSEEPDLEALFENATLEIAKQIDTTEFDNDYGFIAKWEDDYENDGDTKNPLLLDINLEATKKLFDSLSAFSGHEETIERFCLPIFAKANSDYAVVSVKDSVRKRPSMMQIYASYLGQFVNNDNVLQDHLIECLRDPSLYDWQKMWIIAALMQLEKADDKYVKIASAILLDGTRHDALRAVAAVFVGRFGDHPRRTALFPIYNQVSEYVKLAIYYSSRNWPKAERANARSVWGAQGVLPKLMTAGMKVLAQSI